MHNYCVVPDIITVRSSVRYIPRFSLGEHLSVTVKEIDTARHSLKFIVTKNNLRLASLDHKHHYYYVSAAEDSIYCERNLGFGISVRMLIRNINTTPAIYVNRLYYHLVRFPLGALLPPGRHLLDIATIRLLQTGFFPIHCAAVSKNGRCLLMFAPPDTGKTFTALTLYDQGFDILTEDMAVTDGCIAWACPFTGTFYHLMSNTQDPSWRTRLTSMYGKAVNIFPLFARMVRPPVASLWSYTNGKIEPSSKIVGLVFLQRSGTSAIEVLTPAQALRHLKLSNRMEFTYDVNPALLAFASVHKEFDLDFFRTRELEGLHKLSTDYPSVLLRAPHHQDFPSTVAQIFENWTAKNKK